MSSHSSLRANAHEYNLYIFLEFKHISTIFFIMHADNFLYIFLRMLLKKNEKGQHNETGDLSWVLGFL